MKRLFLKLAETRYWLTSEGQTVNFDLENLHLALDPIEDLDIYVNKIPNKNIAFIWSLDSFKELEKIDFKTEQEKLFFEQAYDKYYDKRWNEIPKIEISIPDWDELKQKWAKIKEEKPQYVVFTLDDSGPFDKVDVFGKHELSEHDMQDMKFEHEKYLKYEKARQKYIANHPDYSDVWRGPQDDEYEADIMQYYDQD